MFYSVRRNEENDNRYYIVTVRTLIKLNIKIRNASFCVVNVSKCSVL